MSENKIEKDFRNVVRWHVPSKSFAINFDVVLGHRFINWIAKSDLRMKYTLFYFLYISIEHWSVRPVQRTFSYFNNIISPKRIALDSSQNRKLFSDDFLQVQTFNLIKLIKNKRNRFPSDLFTTYLHEIEIDECWTSIVSITYSSSLIRSSCVSSVTSFWYTNLLLLCNKMYSVYLILSEIFDRTMKSNEFM